MIVSIGITGTPIEVKRPSVALKITGSRREATCWISHVTTGVVESQTMNRSEIVRASVEDDHLPDCLALPHPIEGFVHLIDLDA